MDIDSPLVRKTFTDRGMDAFVPCGAGGLFLSTSGGQRCSIEPAGDALWSLAAMSSGGRVSKSATVSGLQELRGFLEQASALGVFSPEPSLESALETADGGTEREVSVLARTRQSQYRKALSELWGGRCSVTGESFAPLLRASHAKPWSQSSDSERIDPNNGLLLRADYDALFDGGWIGFGLAGECVISEQTPAIVVDNLQLRKTRLRLIPSTAQSSYLQWHMENILKK